MDKKQKLKEELKEAYRRLVREGRYGDAYRILTELKAFSPKPIIKKRLMELHKRFVKKGMYEEASCVYWLLLGKKITLGFNDEESNVERELDYVGTKYVGSISKSNFFPLQACIDKRTALLDVKFFA